MLLLSSLVCLGSWLALLDLSVMRGHHPSHAYLYYAAAVLAVAVTLALASQKPLCAAGSWMGRNGARCMWWLSADARQSQHAACTAYEGVTLHCSSDFADTHRRAVDLSHRGGSPRVGGLGAMKPVCRSGCQMSGCIRGVSVRCQGAACLACVLIARAAWGSGCSEWSARVLRPLA